MGHIEMGSMDFFLKTEGLYPVKVGLFKMLLLACRQPKIEIIRGHLVKKLKRLDSKSPFSLM